MKKTLMLIAAAAVLAGTCLAQDADILNSYDNTEELAQKFRIVNPTPVETSMEKNIQNRLLTGFENWNRGFEAWKAWGDILYTPDSLYNVHGIHMTLAEYQAAMNVTLKQADIKMGDFNNMIISDDWCAIRYDIATAGKDGQYVPGSVMEFVNFADMGSGLGTRVVEGWASIRGKDSRGLSYFLTPEERIRDEEIYNEVLGVEIPDTKNLEEKYPVMKPTKVEGKQAEKMKQILLENFESWNGGWKQYSRWLKKYASRDMTYQESVSRKLTLGEYAEEARERIDGESRVYFENMIISGDWAAVFYRRVITDGSTGERTAGAAMKFIHFDFSGRKPVITECIVTE